MEIMLPHLCQKSQTFELFPDVNYDNYDDFYDRIDLQAYYEESTMICFSNTGKYAVIRVRGNYDPQTFDGMNEDEFTPVYFRSVFVLNMETMSIVLREYLATGSYTVPQLHPVDFWRPNQNSVPSLSVQFWVRWLAMLSTICPTREEIARKDSNAVRSCISAGIQVE
ncbi:MAG: hypothetical protein IKM73_16820 [Acidaminococcaceae bacterium]|nr:hypothetical protein [Acidaminococcaceae bacterium]